jgi:hypothetical protein
MQTIRRAGACVFSSMENRRQGTEGRGKIYPQAFSNYMNTKYLPKN